MQPGDLLTRAEAAVLLKLEPQTLAKWALAGENLPYLKLGKRSVRYRRTDVEAFIERGRMPAAK